MAVGRNQQRMHGAGLDAGDERLHELALRMARACRRVVQGCLREEEWIDCDEAFVAIILAGLNEREAGDGRP